MHPSDIKHLLIVAGPSGAGKSTFMEVLSEGRLPKSIMAQIPEEAARWPHSSFKAVMAEGLEQIGRTGEGLVLHYNLSRGFAMDLPDYFADPAMKFLDEFGACIVVATILPDEELLKEHILKRAHHVHIHGDASAEGPLLRRAWRALRSAAYSLAGRNGTRVKRGQKRLLELYQSPGGLQQWMDQWDDFLDHLCRTRPDTRLIKVEPDHNSSDRPNFRRVPDNTSSHARLR